MTYRCCFQGRTRLCAFLTMLVSLSQLPAATFLVTTNSESGLGSLRSAIDAANANPGLDAIAFNIPGSGVQTITVSTDLPALSDKVIIDATTQPGYAGKPLIVLRAGSFASYGLQLLPGGCVVRGLTVSGFASVGIYAAGASNTIERCFIGTDGTGTLARPNGIGCLMAFGSSFNSIGGTGGAGNVISGNLDLGLCLSYSSNNVVQGNFIGTDATGTNKLANHNDGLSIDHAANNEIGGTEAGEGNLISGNGRDGIRFIDQSASGNVIEGNLIGVDVTGKNSLGNTGAGINVSGAADNTIGGTEAASRNIISANSSGVVIQQARATGNVVQGNWIGLDILGMTALPNSGDGVAISSASQNTVGGIDPGSGNVISGNMGAGVFLGGSSNVVQGNLIGMDATGSSAVPNGTGVLPSTFSGSGVFVLNSSGQTIGGDTPQARNIISGNRYNGIAFDHGQACVVQGNWIGLGLSGQALGNGGSGVLLSESGSNTIGGSNPGEGNVCSANAGYGIVLSGPATAANALMGNYVGVDSDGKGQRGNSRGGIGIGAGASANFIGGSEIGDRNIISGNGGAGILISNVFVTSTSPSSLNVIQGNLIGVEATGRYPVPNFGAGIDVAGPVMLLQIGGNSPGEANQIAFNRGSGVLVRDTNATGVTVSANSIYNNGGLGINLQPTAEPPNTPTPNDALDADSGPNDLQNFPVITNIVFAGGVTVISGYIRSSADEDFDIEIFVNDSYSDAGYGEGQTYLGTASASSDSSGFGEFQFVVSGSFGTQPFTATATDLSTGDTSEFSRQVPTLEGLLRITDIHRSGADVQVSFTTKPGTNYRLEVTTSLTSSSSWSPVSGASNVPGTGGIVSINDPGAASSTPHFYRVHQL